MDAARFYHHFASLLYKGFFEGAYWKLQILTDLSQLPDYSEVENKDNASNRLAPVDSQGNPVFYDLPHSFEEAKNDGERYRFLLRQATLCYPKGQVIEWTDRASQLIKIFGVGTLHEYGSFSGHTGSFSNDSSNSTISSDSTKKSGTSTGIPNLQTLGDNETIIQLAIGIKRFDFPEEQNYISLLKKTLKYDDFNFPPLLNSTIQNPPLPLYPPLPAFVLNPSICILVQEYINRRQYAKAAEVYRQRIEQVRALKATNKPSAEIISTYIECLEELLQQIVGNWGQFESTCSSIAGKKQKLAYRFRNGTSVHFKARRINIEALLADIEEYLRTLQKEAKPLNAEQLDGLKIGPDEIGNLLVKSKEKQKKYLGETVAEWSLDLQPAQGHCDKRILVDLPMTEGGAYFIESKMADGNSDTVVAWMDDFALVTKNLDQARYYYVADPTTGKPVQDVELNFLGYTVEGYSNKSTWKINKFRSMTGENGEFVTGAKGFDYHGNFSLPRRK